MKARFEATTSVIGVKYVNNFMIALPSTIFIRINAPGVMHFSKGGGGATITDTKNQLSSPVVMGDNRHLQP